MKVVSKKDMKESGRIWPSRVIGMAILSCLSIGIAGVWNLTAADSGVELQAAQETTVDRIAEKKYKATKAIILDKETGRLRKPTDQEIEKTINLLKARTSRSTKGLEKQYLSDGREMVDLQGRFGGVWLTRRNADGTRQSKCVSSLEEGAEFLGLVVEETK